MIAHRATVFDENTVVFMHRLQIPVTAELPAGHRAPWRERGRLAIAKLVNNITFSTTKADFPLLLLSDGLEPEDDQFVEVHIYGPISIRSIEKVSLKTRGSAVRRKALREKLSKLGIPLKAH